MILTRSPLRLSLGGGGTDLPSFYQQHGGFVLSAAISRYIYIHLHRRFLPGIVLRYSSMEEVACPCQIRHPLIREVFEQHGVREPMEITSSADIPSGTGLGSSGAFLVGLLHAMHLYRQRTVTRQALAEEAVHIEMERLQEPVGKQDQYIAAYGGLLCQQYNPDGSVRVWPLHMPPGAEQELRESLMMFFVGRTRAASTLLAEQKRRTEAGDPAMTGALRFTLELGREVAARLEAGDIDAFGPLMHQHWLRKRSRSRGMSASDIDSLYELALARGGATGGKLVGAGGSGFLLFQAPDRKRLRTAMLEAGLKEVDFRFDFDGTTLVLRDG